MNIQYKEELFLLNQNNQQQSSTQTPGQPAFGGHELFDAHESIGALIGTLDHFVLYADHVQDPELTGIMQRQQSFLTQMYNTIVDTLTSGHDPAAKTQVYKMEESNQTIYGMSPSAPKKPIQSANELNDECISAGILGHLKGISTHFTTTALEATNPVLRRVFADSIPNTIEMAFEMYLYQNKKQFYQVPTLQPQDAQAIRQSYAPIQGNISH